MQAQNNGARNYQIGQAPNKCIKPPVSLPSQSAMECTYLIEELHLVEEYIVRLSPYILLSSALLICNQPHPTYDLSNCEYEDEKRKGQAFLTTGHILLASTLF